MITALFSYYQLAYPDQGLVGGFSFETVRHITLESIAKGEEPQVVALYDRPKIDKDRIRVSGPFTVEAISLPASMVAGDTTNPGKADQPDYSSGGEKVGDKVEASDYVTTLIQILQKDGVTFPGGKKLVIEALRPIVSPSMIHAEGATRKNGGTQRVAISFGPRYGPVNVKQVDDALRLSYRMGFEMLIFAGFAFDPEARATIEKNPIPKMEVHFANISPDIVVSDLLKTTKGSQLFTVFGEPDIRIERHENEYVVRLLGIDTYDPVTGRVQQSPGQDVPAWFLDEDYDGLTFRMMQAFFPNDATKKNPWDRLENALHGVVDRDKMEAFRGLESLPFKPGRERKIAVKVIDVRGNEVMVIKDLAEEAKAN
jgi:adenine-specific DNA-methyltransferase